MTIGRLTSIHRYPVKALRGESLTTAEILADGLAGDRTAALRVASADHARSGKTYRGKEDARLHTLGDAAAGIASAARNGLTAELDTGGRYFDALPVSLIFDRWLDELAALAGRPVEALRFRPNLVVAAAPGFAAAEAELTGRALHVGGAILAVVQPIVRCVTPSYDLATGVSDGTLLRAIAQQRGNIVGVYCTVVQPGAVATGAAVEID